MECLCQIPEYAEAEILSPNPVPLYLNVDIVPGKDLQQILQNAL